jgi:hypothetical protein
MIETPEQLRREIAYRVDERIGISVGSGIPSKSLVEFAHEEATQWARKHYPELLGATANQRGLGNAPVV